MPPIFEQNASIILLGMRGVGKSTLASIAARAVGWPVVEERSFFEASAGISMSAYIDRHGLESYRRRQLEVLVSLLRDQTHRHVIECTSGCIQTAEGRSLLAEACTRHPVIHLTRDLASVETFLSDKWHGDVSRVRREQEPVFESCSNLAFYNLDSAKFPPASSFAESDPLQPGPLPSGRDLLSFKCVEHDFVRFLTQLGYGSDDPVNADAINPSLSRHLEEPLAPTYMLPITLEMISGHYSDLAALETCIDCFQLCVDIQDTSSPGNLRIPSREELSSRYALLRRMTGIPIALHVRAEGATLRIDTALERAYFDLLFVGLKLGCEYLFVDLDVRSEQLGELAARKGRTRLVGCYHNEAAADRWDAKDRLDICSQARELGLDAVQLVQPGMMKEDNVSAISFARQMQKVGDGSVIVSAFNSGLLGRQSQCFNTFMTPVRTAVVEPLRDQWDGDVLTPQEIENALFSSFASSALDFYTVGTDVTYSVAPAVTSASFAAYGMPHTYHKLSTDALARLLDLAGSPRFGGAGLSSPFKTDVVGALQSIGRDVQIIGAVNTILPVRSWSSTDRFDLREQRDRGGKVLGLHGENTDWLGMKKCILRHLSPANAITPDTTALVIGAGGMSRAAVYAAVRCGVQSVFIWSRTYSRALTVADQFRSRADVFRPLLPTFHVLESLSEPWPRHCKQPTIIIDCLPYPSESADSRRGTDTATDEPLKIPDRWMRSPHGGVYLQLAYNTPLPSPVLCQVALKGYRGWVGVSGLEIFLEVAMAQFEYWCGRRAPRAVMSDALRKEFLASAREHA